MHVHVVVARDQVTIVRVAIFKLHQLQSAWVCVSVQSVSADGRSTPRIKFEARRCALPSPIGAVHCEQPQLERVERQLTIGWCCAAFSSDSGSCTCNGDEEVSGRGSGFREHGDRRDEPTEPKAGVHSKLATAARIGQLHCNERGMQKHFGSWTRYAARDA